MIRQILGHSIYQLVIILLLVFYGEEIFDIRSGRRPDLTEQERDDDLTTQHYTIVFNSFVWMQLFNEVNARVIDDRLSCPPPGCSAPGPLGAFLRPWKGLLNNPIFVGVLIGTAGVQALIVEFGGQAISTRGLSGEQWGACIVSLGLVAGSLLLMARVW
jgi:Ca2+ transporting ATPase